MLKSEKKLCIFIHFFKDNYFPKYVKVYVKELSGYFDELILVTNQRQVSSNESVLFPNVRLLFVPNEGYDMGMFHKATKTINLEDYSQIACINDSNILFQSLEPVFRWGNQQQLDFWGLIDSYEKPWFSTHYDNHHIQSHFLVFNKKAIDLLNKFFESIELEKLLREKDVKKLRRSVINNWEIGLTQFFKKEGLKVGSFIDSKSFSENNGIKKATNLGHSLYFRLIEEGYPMIKKKVVFNSKSLKFFFRPQIKWDAMMLKYGKKDWDIEGLVNDLKRMKIEQ
ncbi:rhamnan synthesis F family protein [Cognataquiflexum rubidum]|uniref:rhamnan synthesis F family protein n=1 Tax=Cognataquiflexum rubidum TaxID=2922273 RepID=UPI001F12AC9E|nr:rhamnan synthesis F family protein [Cognataquiflexum rubidum]MCH6232823.1 rhamnan synthesis F family protein [Cognataquiflexum rubidum]